MEIRRDSEGYPIRGRDGRCYINSNSNSNSKFVENENVHVRGRDSAGRVVAKKRTLFDELKKLPKRGVAFFTAVVFIFTLGIGIGKLNSKRADANARATTSMDDPDFVDMTYKIVVGDTLEGIANRFNKTVSEIAQVNSICEPYYIYAGENLIIPNVSKELADDYNTNGVEKIDITYEVQSGDTLEAISEKFGVSVDEIVKGNNIADKNSIQVGQVLQIPNVSILTVEKERTSQEEVINEQNSQNQEALQINSLNCKNLQEGYFRVIDISELQKGIDWDKLEEEYKKGTFSHMILRINENIDSTGTKRQFTIDGDFEKNLSECNKRGIPYGVYSLSRASTEAEVNTETASLINYINNNLNTTKEVNGETLDLTFNLSLPVYMDCFEGDAVSQSNLIKTGQYGSCVNLIDLWCSNMEQAGYFTGVYTSHYNINLLGKDNLSEYTLWIADYGNNIGIDVDKVGLANRVALDGVTRGHQITSVGKINGINGNVDVSIFDGDLLDIVNAYYKNSNKILTYRR